MGPRTEAVQGSTDQGERARNREALVANGMWRKSSGRVGKNKGGLGIDGMIVVENEVRQHGA